MSALSSSPTRRELLATAAAGAVSLIAWALRAATQDNAIRFFRVNVPEEQLVAARVHPLRRPGRRLGVPRLERHGAPGAGRFARHPHQLAGDRAARDRRGARRRRACAGGTHREGTRDVRRAQRVRQNGQQVLRP